MPADGQDPTDAAMAAVRRAVYGRPPEAFTDARADQLAAHPELAAEIGRLRKHTLAAWIVNAYAAGSGVADQLAGLRDELLAAYHAGDQTQLRELTLRRRRTVADLTASAVAASGRTVGGTVRDAVSDTFDAAVLDPELADRLGALQRQQREVGGFDWPAAGGLHLVPDRSADQPDEPHEDEQDTAARDRAGEAVQLARDELAAAEDGQDQLEVRLRRLTTRLQTLQHEIADVRDELDAARDRVARARRDLRQRHADSDRLDRR